MGGKKKTKWRKLPLAEFTKDCPSTEKLVVKHDYKTDVSTNEEKHPSITVYEDPSEIVNQYSHDYREFAESMLYPTSYFLYNAVEPIQYPNYVMPADPCCYYILPPEMPAVQEYTPIAYPEYIPPAKDTLYLLLPAPALRSTNSLPHIAYDWRNRRRRRRYEGYAEYAVIPEKTSYSSNKEERDQKKKSVLNTNLGKNDNPFSNTKTLTSSSETSSNTRDSQKDTSDPSLKPSSTTEENCVLKKNMAAANEEKITYSEEKQTAKPRKNGDICAVHSSRSKEKIQAFQNKPENMRRKKTHMCKLISTEDYYNSFLNDSDSTEESEASVVSVVLSSASGQKKDCEVVKSVSSNNDPPKNLLGFQNTLETVDKPNANNIQEVTENPMGATEFTEVRLSDNTKEFEKTRKEHIIDKQNGLNEVFSEVKENDDTNTSIEAQNISEIMETDPLFSASKMLVHESTVIEKLFKNVKLSDTDSEDKSKTATQKIPIAERVSTHTSHIPLLSNNASYNSEADLDWKHSTPLRSLRDNKTIYKFAYDENVTDQSNSKSPSPIDPEIHIPSSIPNSEIIIHEANSDSDAGSEDVELIPHRYESESFLNASKHVYVNKLSLAVELLRTKEELPYDDQFKRVVNENGNDANGQVNRGFVDDSLANISGKKSNDVITNQSQAKKHPGNGAVAGGVPFYEVAKEAAETTLSSICKMCSVS